MGMYMVCSSKVATGLLHHDVPRDQSLITVIGGGREAIKWEGVEGVGGSK